MNWFIKLSQIPIISVLSMRDDGIFKVNIRGKKVEYKNVPTGLMRKVYVLTQHQNWKAAFNILDTLEKVEDYNQSNLF
jgi:hypothetical protein